MAQRQRPEQKQGQKRIPCGNDNKSNVDAGITLLAWQQRIQTQLSRGAFSEPSELLSYALDLVEAEAVEEDWLIRNKEAIDADLERTFAQAQRGEGYSLEESRALLAQHRASRAA